VPAMSGFGIFREVIASESELRELYGEPSRLVQNKVITQIDDHVRNYITQAPFLILATADEKGNCDASPRGDAPGFVHIIDDNHLVIPERPGNKRMDSITNILANPQVGLIFLIPTLEETLRINGRACVIRDAELLEKMGKRKSACTWNWCTGRGVLHSLRQSVYALRYVEARDMARRRNAPECCSDCSRPCKAS